jgi:hypothetical protein
VIGVVGWLGQIPENDQVRTADLLALPNPIFSRSHNIPNIAPIDELFD